jgi:hypothetical protein
MTTAMTTEKASELRNELEDVREAWREWTEQWEAFGRTLRHAGTTPTGSTRTGSGPGPTRVAVNRWRAGSARSRPT